LGGMGWRILSRRAQDMFSGARPKGTLT